MELSIIVPIYNTENYLQKCIDSLLHQDIEDYEILLVNDSSPDHAQEIIDDYQKRFPNMIRSFKKPNGGLGDTRNFAIPHAKGRYLMFVDSDDYIKENVLGKLCRVMNERELDILVYNFVRVYNDEKFVSETSMKNNSKRDYILSTPNACNKIFRTTLFTENKILFPCRIWYEDIAVIPGVAKYTEKIDYVDEDVYYYCYRQNSIMNQTAYNVKMLDMIESIQHLSYYLKDDFKEELEFLSLHHLFYGTSLKLVPLKRYVELGKCLEEHEKNFPKWKNNRYYKEKPVLFKLYCNLLKYRRYFLCSILLAFKNCLKK